MLNIRQYFPVILLAGLGFSCQKDTQVAQKSAQPNVVVIYLDDLGLGDLSCYGATALSTPNIDQLSNEGVRFTNGYATSSTCTPSRYGILTGGYPWKNKNAEVLPGDAPLIVSTTQETLPKMFKKAGYATGAVGKWHLGLGDGTIDWNKKINLGPNEVGFDYSYIMAATNDRVPTVFVEDGLVVGLEANDPIQVDYNKNFEGQPTGLDNPELLKMQWSHGHNNSISNGIPRIGFMKGGEKALWIDEDMGENFLGKAQDFMKAHKEEPFFLYYALHQPHVPRIPNPKFAGATDLGPRGDVIVEADWLIGEFMKTLKEEGLADNTIIVFSSDNGPVLNDGYKDMAVEKVGNHKPWADRRGGKYSLYDAGTHVPFIVWAPSMVKPGTSDALVCQMDLLNSFGSLFGIQYEQSDSENVMDALLGKVAQGRDNLILEAEYRLSLRHGDWLMIPPQKGESFYHHVNMEIGRSDDYQLFNMKQDPGQQVNLAKQMPEKIEELKAIMRTKTAGYPLKFGYENAL
ncbi:sulfatase-like hydrolase/transferase [Persicobacter psychrovividus]|uniref:Arylsulfatase n=1 Tax=Persicobacter psychrovividus TaxID=387638 RepID=A0ABM7VIN0_9BACT|nr:arylsulfatase [Persicobacter psychrovividus]